LLEKSYIRYIIIELNLNMGGYMPAIPAMIAGGVAAMGGAAAATTAVAATVTTGVAIGGMVQQGKVMEQQGRESERSLEMALFNVQSQMIQDKSGVIKG
jgi:hypothetical protein